MFFAWNFHVISMHIFSGDVCLNASFLNLIFELKIIVTRSTRPFKVYQAQPKDEYCSIIRGKWLWMAMSTENKTSNWRHAWLHQSWALKLALNPFFDSRPLRLTPFLLVSSTLSHLIILILYFHSSHYKTLKSNFWWRSFETWTFDILWQLSPYDIFDVTFGTLCSHFFIPNPYPDSGLFLNRILKFCGLS